MILDHLEFSTILTRTSSLHSPKPCCQAAPPSIGSFPLLFPRCTDERGHLIHKSTASKHTKGGADHGAQGTIYARTNRVFAMVGYGGRLGNNL